MVILNFRETGDDADTEGHCRSIGVYHGQSIYRSAQVKKFLMPASMSAPTYQLAENAGFAKGRQCYSRTNYRLSLRSTTHSLGPHGPDALCHTEHGRPVPQMISIYTDTLTETLHLVIMASSRRCNGASINIVWTSSPPDTHEHAYMIHQ